MAILCCPVSDGSARLGDGVASRAALMVCTCRKPILHGDGHDVALRRCSHQLWNR